jgi:hypothetical protein
MNKPHIVNFIIIMSLILTIGLITGYSIGYFRAAAGRFPDIKFTNDINHGAATLKLLEVKNGKLTGEVVGRDARIAYAPDKIIEIDEGDTFEIPLDEIDLKSYYQASDLPEDALFVASRSGKYYYSVLDKRAFNLSVGNRIFFSSSSEAEKMGYVKK